MNITFAEFAVATAVGIAAGWLWSSDESSALDFVSEPVNRALAYRSRTGPAAPLFRWVDDMQSCPICLGFWVQLAAVAVIAGLTAWTVPLALSSLVVHLAWQRIVALISALILR